MAKKPDYKNEGLLLPPVLPDIKDWPIVKLLKKNKPFVEEVKTETLEEIKRICQRDGISLQQIIERAMYLERIRIAEDPWKIDPKDDPKFWSRMKKELVDNEQLQSDPEAVLKKNLELADTIVERYATEISSSFKPSTYHFAKRFLPFFFSTLLNASGARNIRNAIYHRIGLQEKVHLKGEIDALRTLAKKGTIILVPTHISNVDSILVGWGLHALGLPAFIYGAGLNLFNSKLVGFFMGRLGAYKVDRRKKNAIYRATLDTYSTRAISHNVHSLFFPGGTRSRTGTIEKRLKLGLLGTAVEAQRLNLLPGGSGKKVFVVPMVMSYHFVLEAKTLINQHLKRTGQDKYYILRDEFASYRKILMFVWKTFGKTSEITLNFGKPMDLFGNFVDNEGNSYDAAGKELNIREYFMSGGEMKEDKQRDEQYTRMLGDKIVERYHAENHVFSSYLVAFVAFEMLKKRYARFDLYALLRLPQDERTLSMKAYLEKLTTVLERLREMRDQEKVMLAEHMEASAMDIIRHGIKNLGLYHDKRPLSFVKGGDLISENMNLLYYYHNRLEGYGLEKYI